MASAPEIHLVLLFVPSHLNHNSKPDHDISPKEELSNLIRTLTSAGLNVTARPAFNGAQADPDGNTTTNLSHAQEIYVFVSAPPSKLAELYNAQAHADFLLGVPAPSWRARSKNSDRTTPKLPSADKIRLVYEYITSLKVDGGLNITVGTPHSVSGFTLTLVSHLDTISDPGLNFPHHNVKSIFTLHDQSFNRRWLESWTRQRRGFHISFSELCKIRDEFRYIQLYSIQILHHHYNTPLFLSGFWIAYDISVSSLEKQWHGFYFAFLSSYASSLFIPAALGFLFWITTRPYSILFSTLLTLWSISWVEWWRVREKIIAVRWGTLGSYKAERRRVGFKPDQGKMSVKNDPTSEFDDLDAAFPWYKRELRILASVPLIILFGALLAAVLTGIFIIEAFVTQLYHGPGYQYVSLFPTVLLSLLIPTFLASYHRLATRFTMWENHAHDSGFDNSLTIKSFALSAIVAYLGLALSAFLYVPFGGVIMRTVEGVFVDESGNESKAVSMGRFKRWGFGARQGRELDTGRLQNQMFAFTVTNQIINTLQEIVVPYIMRGIEEYRNGGGWNSSKKNSGTPVSGGRTPQRKATELEMMELTNEREWETKFLKQVRKNAMLPDYTLFGDYAEMVTQFGYVALWSTIWPLAPVMAFLNNWLEMRSDAFKIMTHSRRPLPKRVESIGAWLDCMAFISWLGTLTNAALVYLFHPEKHAVLSSHFGTTLRTTVLGSVGGSSGNFGVGNMFRSQVQHSQIYFRIPVVGQTQSHLEKHLPQNQGDLASTIASTWHVLLMPALLVTLASSHGYILLRAAIGHIVRRAVWNGSSEEREIKRVGEVVKEAYLGKVSLSKDGNAPFGVSVGLSADEVESNDLSDMERLFWERDLDEAGVWSAISKKED
ncbi:hypothetical protein Clacol_005621 [Clathrus columnatus]|uniref:DUF590-domain-containing protein n=1 Tax=Clathrus columnatus TaxID=1419009 RepID=A0AAV5AD38_9AGAM|nr:hypothetical protein Clacol_005621 [Clathrus columnatus]